MKKCILLVTLVLSLAPIAARAQESDIRVGFGVSIAQNLAIISNGGNYFTPFSFSTVSIPLFLTKNFRIEPEFGLLTWSRERTNTDNTTSNSSESQLRLGAGFHYMIRNLGGSENVAAYLGPHFDILPTSSKSSSTGSTESTTSQSNLILGLVVGGEYAVAKCFSIGTEVQFNYISIGEETHTPSSTSTSSTKEHYLNISTAVTARFYFN